MKERKDKMDDAAILAGLRGQNEKATYQGHEGYFVQAECIFITAPTPAAGVKRSSINMKNSNRSSR